MTPEEIVVKLSDTIQKLDPIDGQPSDTNLTRIREVMVLVLLQILYEEMGDTHNLISLIWTVTSYTTHYSAKFVKPTRVGAYDTTIDDNTTAVVRVRMEAAHKAKRADRGTYDTARQETAQFILAVVKYTWVQELQDTETFYTDVAPKALLTHLQSGYTGRHALDFLALHN